VEADQQILLAGLEVHREVTFGIRLNDLQSTDWHAGWWALARSRLGSGQKLFGGRARHQADHSDFVRLGTFIDHADRLLAGSDLA
jgi:hypothetical protein